MNPLEQLVLEVISHRYLTGHEMVTKAFEVALNLDDAGLSKLRMLHLGVLLNETYEEHGKDTKTVIALMGQMLMDIADIDNLKLIAIIDDRAIAETRVEDYSVH